MDRIDWHHRVVLLHLSFVNRETTTDDYPPVDIPELCSNQRLYLLLMLKLQIALNEALVPVFEWICLESLLLLLTAQLSSSFGSSSFVLSEDFGETSRLRTVISAAAEHWPRHAFYFRRHSDWCEFRLVVRMLQGFHLVFEFASCSSDLSSLLESL